MSFDVGFLPLKYKNMFISGFIRKFKLSPLLAKSITFAQSKLPKQQKVLTGRIKEFLVGLQITQQGDETHYEEFVEAPMNLDLKLDPPLPAKDALHN